MKITDIRTDKEGLLKVLNFLDSEENRISEGADNGKIYFELISIEPFYSGSRNLSFREKQGGATYKVGIQALHPLPEDRSRALTQLADEIYKKK